MNFRFKSTNLCVLLTFALIPFISSCGDKTITGSVKDPNGVPVEDVLVQVENSLYQANTDTDGNYSIKYAPGNFVVMYTKKGYSSYKLNLSITQKVQFHAKDIELYPLKNFTELYDSDIEESKRLSPKAEWDINVIINQFKRFTEKPETYTDDAIKAIFDDDFASEMISRKNLYIESSEKEDIGRVSKIGKITDIRERNNYSYIDVNIEVTHNGKIIPVELRLIGDKNTQSGWKITRLY